MSGCWRRLAAFIAAHWEEIIYIEISLIGAFNIFVWGSSDLYQFWGRTAGWVSLIAYLPYISSIRKGQTKPSKITWWVWTILETLITASYWQSGAEETIWIPVSGVIGMLITAAYSIKYGDEDSKTPLDTGCLAGAAIGITMWILFESSLLALVAFLITDMSAAVPTVWKCWKKPHTEDMFAWIMTFSGSMINLLAVREFSLSVSAYTFYVIIIYGSVVTILLNRKQAPCDD